MTTTTRLAPGLTLISPQGKQRERMIEGLTAQMAEVIVRSGLPLDDHDAITLALYEHGYPVPWIAHLVLPAIELARKALAVAETYDLEISDREVRH